MATPTKKHADPERAQARRQQVLDAAEKCFAQHGFHAASMAEISQAAHMSAGHIYNYFASKEEIIGAIAEQKIETLFGQADDSLFAHIERCIEDSQDKGRQAVMYDILATSLRDAKIGALIGRLDGVAKSHLTKLCADQANALPEAVAQQTDILRMLLMGFRFCKTCDPHFDDKAASQSIHALANVLFNPDFPLGAGSTDRAPNG